MESSEKVTNSKSLCPSSGPTTLPEAVLPWEVCEQCQHCLDTEVNQVKGAAEEEINTLVLKLEHLEHEAICELEDLQSELLEARADNERLQQALQESEQKRLQEQELKKKLEEQLLHSLGNDLLSRLAPDLPVLSSQTSNLSRSDALEDNCNASQTSSIGMADQPGTPDQQEQLANYPGPSPQADGNRRLSDGEVSGSGMEELALALAHLREEFRRVTTELVTKKMELALSEEAMLKMIDKYEKRGGPQAPATTSRLSFWRGSGK